MKLQKLTSAITSAMGYLENSMKRESQTNDEDLSGLVWKAAADLEYALFLFSIMRQDDSESSSWKLSLHSKDVEIGRVLASAIDFVKEAKSNIDAGKLDESHKKTWMARGCLLKLQEFFEKKRKLEEAAT